MGMTPSEQIDFFTRQGVRFEKALKDTADFIHAGQTARTAYRARLMAGLITWRHGMGNPRELLEKAHVVARWPVLEN